MRMLRVNRYAMNTSARGRALMHHADHLTPFNLERGTVGNRRRGRQTQTFHSTQLHSITNEVACGQDKCNRGFFAGAGDNSESWRGHAKIEDGVGWISLREEGLLGLHVDDFSSYS